MSHTPIETQTTPMKETDDGRRYTDKVENTLPWIWSGAFQSVADPEKKPYAIGAIVSKNLGCCVVALTHDGADMNRNIENCNTAGKFIVECCNTFDPTQEPQDEQWKDGNNIAGDLP